MPITILKGHTSPETAYVVDDYPYGFRLRCKIRYWIEYRKGHGFRFVTQTTNPKITGREVWNKPKPGIYATVARCMYLDENEHVQCTGLSGYRDAAEASKWLETYSAGLDEEALARARNYVRILTAQEERRRASAA